MPKKKAANGWRVHKKWRKESAAERLARYREEEAKWMGAGAPRREEKSSADVGSDRDDGHVAAAAEQAV